MPELPEVETIRRNLAGRLENTVISRVEVHLPRLIKRPLLPEFVSGMTGAVIRAIRRRGKHLLFDLSDGKHLLIHLRMTGRLTIEDCHREGSGARVSFHLVDGRILQYADSRTLGVIALLGSTPEREWPSLARLGPEPLTEGWNDGYLHSKTTGRKLAVKSLLLDQTVVAGVGNIYADEALFEAGIDPRRPAASLGPDECRRLAEA
ncbi:MAG: hypothetical protein N3A57_07205, partial [Negativicutes bacterium]|nr:hypothetical protein [Negativicutes bacterium]